MKTSNFKAHIPGFRKACLLIGVFLLFVQSSQAADALKYFKNYFVTGDYVVGGVGLRGKGVLSPALGGYFATGTITIGGNGPNGSAPVPATNGVPADIVAAFLYWQTDEPVSAAAPSAMNGFFDGNPIVGAVVGNAQNPACAGTPSAWWGRVYRADVLRYLSIDHVNNVRIANGPHTVSLPDAGTRTTGPYTNGASLVIIYRTVVSGQPLIAPLNAVILYDGAYTMARNADKMTQTIGGFYQAYQNVAVSITSKMTEIVGNGQPGFDETLNINTATRPGTFKTIFTGTAGPRWDNPTFNFYLQPNESTWSSHVTFNGQACLTWGAVVTSIRVLDTDNDGLLDVWETRGLHLNTQANPATFGGCADYPSEPCVNLPAMGANPSRQDVFVEFDWLRGTDGHTHNPKLDALSAMAATFALHGISLHFDVGNNYQGQGLPYIIAAQYTRGGDVIDESTLLCPNARTTHCAFAEPYSVLSWKKGFRAVKDGFPLLGMPSHFDHNRKDIFHYVLFAHALGIPSDLTPTVPKSTSGVADRPGGDLMITLGLWRSDDPAADQTGTVLVQAGTLMHELGHNLGLSHAGLYRAPNCMPNYPSVMNYLYQTRGLTGADLKEHIDYSNGLLGNLDEGHVTEGPLGPMPYRLRFYGTPLPNEGLAKAHCDGTPINGASAVRLEGSGLSTPDWNRNGSIDALDYTLDLNYSGSIEDGVAGSRLFVDSNDWAALNLQQIGARLNVHGLSSDIGQTDLGQTDLGQTDLGQTDLGQTDLGQTDLGQTDLGQTDLGQTDLGDVDYDAVISSLDATSSEQPLTAVSKIDRVTLNWGTPSIGQIRHYNIYRTDPSHPAAVLIGHVDGAPPATTYDDVVSDTAHSGASCPNLATCYNTAYTYYVTSVDVNGTESGASNTAPGKITHLFAMADSKTVVYGAELPALTFTVYGEVAGSLSGASCAYTLPATPHNVGTYSITCTGPSTTSATDGVTYNAAYSDGLTPHTPGSLTITKAPLTLTAQTNSKTYDGTTSASATPAVAGLQYLDTVSGTVETYDTRNFGSGKTLTITAYVVNDGNGGSNYDVTTLVNTTGAIDKAALTITAQPNTKTYDATTSAAATPAVSGVQTGDSVTGLAEIYDTAEAGTGKTLSVSAFTVNDGNSGNNYTVTTRTDPTGVINKADATINITPYSLTYDGNPHTATGTARGVNNVDLSSGLDLSATTHTDAADYPGDAWSFSGGNNYNNANGTTHDHIDKANAAFNLTPYHVSFDTNAHTATGTATGVNGVDLSSGLNLSATTHTAIGNYSSDAWSFSGGTNYNNAGGTISDSISKADSTTRITSVSGIPGASGFSVEATVTSSIGVTPTGTALITNGNGSSCTATLSGGVGKCFLASTSQANLTATYSGDAIFNPSAGTQP